MTVRVLFVVLSMMPLLAAQEPSLPPVGVALLDIAVGIPEVFLNTQEVRHVQRGDYACLDIAPSTNPYEHVGWSISLAPVMNLAGARGTLVVEFFDEGAGLIDPEIVSAETGHPLAAIGRSSNYTRLNTLQPRQAWFALRLPHSLVESPAELRITGIDYVHAVRLLPEQSEAAWAEHDAKVPANVQPMITLQRPMSLTTTAGVDVRGGMNTLQASLQAMNELAPLARVLGFTSIESYVTWKRLEPNREGEFDFSYYDSVVEKLRQYNLKWFPLLIVGSAYALPDWFRESKENVGLACLEHGISNDIQSLWSPHHVRHVERVLHAIGAHYEPMGIFEGVRLGPSGNYGESQYPAGGNWGVEGERMHIHIGWWAADPYALLDYRQFLYGKYPDIAALNTAWDAAYPNFDSIQMVLPEFMRSKRQRIDFTTWYTDEMTQWCELWAKIARDAMPKTSIYQSAGGWGFRETGTDYAAQAKSMVSIGGGIRLTNETDSYEQNFYATRLAATAARLYNMPLGYEPASSHTARGTAGRIFETITTNGDHWFTYHSNIFSQPGSIEKWLHVAPMLNWRQAPIIDVAVYYPETFNQLEDSAFRHLYAWGFNPRAAAVRRVVEVDYLDEHLIREGFLDRYKTLVFCWGEIAEADVLAMIDAWVRNGGTVIYPSFPRGPMTTVEGSSEPFERWSKGGTGSGQFRRFKGDMEPTSEYGDFVKEVLLQQSNLHPWTQLALQATHPAQVFLSIQPDGHLLALSYEDDAATVRIPGIPEFTMAPYDIVRVPLPSR
ncbi:MAG: beta-galactosidase [Candidatus Hydrogenedentes bacterium]|nr:beta-galactosidase [Candidatus Hydrogenedentota bacterium]